MMIGDLFAPMHLILILIIALIIFGPGKLPELGSSLGKAIREFKKVMETPDIKTEPKIESPPMAQKIEETPKSQEIDGKVVSHDQPEVHPQA